MASSPELWPAKRPPPGSSAASRGRGNPAGTLGPTATAEEVLDALARDGAVVITGLAAPELCAAVAAQAAARPASGRLVTGCEASHELLAHPLVMEVCDAALGCQALRMEAAELQSRLALPGNFTSQRPLRQLPWELDFARADGVAHPPPNPAPSVAALSEIDYQLTAVWQLSADGADGSAGELSDVPIMLPAGSVLLALGSGSDRWQPRQAQLLAAGYQLGFLQPAENHYLSNSIEDVAALPMHMQRLLGFHLPGQILNKVYVAPGDHDILKAMDNLAGNAIDWATDLPVPKTAWEAHTIFAKRRPPTHEEDSEYLAVPAQATPPAPPPPLAAGSVGDVVAELEPLFSGYNSGYQESLPALSETEPVVSVDWPAVQGQGLAEVVGRMLAALDRDGAVVLSNAVPASVCDAIEAEIAPYKWRSRADGRPEGVCGSLLSRSEAVQQMAAHPAVVAAVEGALGRQLFHPR